MELINGVSFEEYAAACGNLAQGMPESEICRVLGIEKPVWDETLDKWNDRLGDIIAADMNMATKYGELFANPKAGRFAGVEGPAVDINELLKVVPDFDAYQKIFWHQSVASKYGVDPVSVIEEYGLDIGKWGALNMHYIAVQNQLLDHTHPDYERQFRYFTDIMQKHEQHFEAYYKDKKVDLAGDINF